MIFGITFLTLTVLEWAVFSFFFLWLTLAAGWDRNYRSPSQKWWAFTFFIVGFFFWFFWPSTFEEIKAKLTTWDFYQPFLYYLGAGLFYSVAEFYMEIRRSEKYYAKKWKDFDIESKVASDLRTKKEKPYKQFYDSYLDDFIRHYGRNDRPLQLKHQENNSSATAPVPFVNKKILASYVSAWTVLWPFYATSLILYDVLAEVWNWVADVLVAISEKFIKARFKNTFELKRDHLEKPEPQEPQE
jgi:hypothetical protein